MRDHIIAAAAMRAVVGDIDGNLERVRRLARRAAGRGAGLLVLPEACLTGYTVRESMAHLAQPVPGPLTSALAGIAGEYGMLLSAGLVERGIGDAMHITQVVAGPEGLVAAYRKTHLGPTEETWFRPGDRLSVFDWNHTRYGLQLCYEGHFPEMALAQALAGADVILVPHASPRESPPEKLDRWLRYLPARAYDNTVYLAAANLAGGNGRGLRFAGVALILGPKGQVLASEIGSDEKPAVAAVTEGDLRAVREGRMGYFLPLRRPGLYANPDPPDPPESPE